MLVFRIGHKNYAATLGSSGVNSRWVSAGKHVIYSAENLPLAFLESMVRRQGVGFNADFKTVFIEIPDDLPITYIDENALDPDWRHPYDYSHCQPIGNKWYDDMRIPILKVPSAIMPGSYNYVMNTLHPDFKHIQIVAVTDLVPDPRIEDILKKYQA